jgi:transcriptional regulator with XRE-family HTH domain
MSKNPKDKAKTDKARLSGPKDKPKKHSKREVFVGPGPVAGQAPAEVPTTSAGVPATSPEVPATSAEVPAEAAEVPTTSATSAETAEVPTTSAETVELGERLSSNLRALRKARGLSLEALAQASGVSRAALSQIETGKSNPSIGAVWKIATGLGVPFGELIGEDRRGAEVLRRSQAPRIRSADGALESRALVRTGAVSLVEAYALTLTPGGRHAAEAHATGTRELLVVVEGRVRLTVGHRTYELEAGDSVVFAADLPHVYENPGLGAAVVHDVLLYAR